MSVAGLLLFNFALSMYMTRVICTVELVRYPAFALIGPTEFPAFHQAHTTRISYVVMVPMLAELALAGWLTWVGHCLGASVWVALVLLGVVWLATAALQVPLHNQLTAVGYNAAAIRKLVQTNWLRTVAWTLRSLLLGWLLWHQLPM